MDEELHRFKQLPLPQFAAEQGYQFVARERTSAGHWRGSTASSVLMRHPTTDDKVVIRRDGDGHWVYFSVRDNSDHGTIVDFLQRRGSQSLGQVRLELRRWSGLTPVGAAQLPPYSPPEHDRARKRAAITEAFQRLRTPTSNRYLNSRGIRPETLRGDRFQGAWLEDERGNVIFPHRDDPPPGSVCGWEKKNRGFTGFSTDGDKTIWISRAKHGDTKLVVCEAAIDALSYHQLQPDDHARYASTAGSMGRRGEEFLRRAIERMPAGSTCVLATDRDLEGDKYAARIATFSTKVSFMRHASPIGKDWNDALKDHEREYIRSLSLGR